MKVYCNPLAIPLKYQKQKKNRPLYREAGDITIALYKEKYYMFSSMSGGVYISDDLYDWEFQPTEELPVCDYAPDIEVIGDYMYFSASRRDKSCYIYRTNDVTCQHWEKVAAPLPLWDPAMFCDDDGRVYMYWGCDAKAPIYGIELDNKTFMPVGQKVGLINSDAKKKGFEINGENNVFKSAGLLMRLLGMDSAFLEGAWMNKINGKYYLQYSSPGTALNVYNNAVYVSDKPLGPFVLQKHNPMSMKPGGFITAAGHGSTFYDKYKNLWNVATMRISVNDRFERRIGLFPADIDQDGILYCNTSFGDYPKQIIEAKMNSPYDCDLDWNLLSYKAEVKATSEQEDNMAINLVDEDIRTCWMPKLNDETKEIEIKLKDISKIKAIQVSIADRNVVAPDRKYNYRGTMTLERDLVDVEKPHSIEMYGKNGKEWEKIVCEETISPEYFVHFDEAKQYKYLKLKVTGGSFEAPIALSGLRVFGQGNGEKPNKTKLTASRIAPTSMRLKWNSVNNSNGYEIHWGIAPDKLYLSWLVYEKLELDVNSLISGQEYYVAIDTFNENGVTKGKPIKVE